ncbi:class I SAM-dependent methyltransferase [Afifella sp. IM 167]|uniref:class I SAM-dependent methyltransferase n=1 Tax=Afifella sp. IM 167 TaxID=2033586 RepID=UPI001CC97E6A|nr:class I SAM-dependent methyltransferase [Afifella sp. IM 167]MBZ8133417.1 ubiquinone biosynthesis protein [Afifella sp. IM 167]
MASVSIDDWANGMRYAAVQGARVAWYTGHGLAMRRMLKSIAAKHPQAAPRVAPPSTPVPDLPRLLRDVGKLMARDYANVRAGLYPMPDPEEADLGRVLATSRAFFADVPEVARRRREGASQEVGGKRGEGNRPRYYMQNFHFQSGGWMSEESARLYDMQVEVLFNGAASAMRRQALVPVAQALKGRDQRELLAADIACGTGRFVGDLRGAYPRLPVIALDLSEEYVGETRRHVGRAATLRPMVGKAEALPLSDASLDLASAIYLFHELPPKVRRQVAGEIARVVKPGGTFILVDSLQPGDAPDYDGLLEVFPQLFHEPYYNGYLKEDLARLFAPHGLVAEKVETAFFSKIVTFRRAA